MNRKRQAFQNFGIVLGIYSLFALSCGIVFAQTPSTGGGGSTTPTVLQYGGSVVGGVEINAEGVLRTAPKASLDNLGKALARLLEPVPDDLAQEATIRKISLKSLNHEMEKVVKSGQNGGSFSDSLHYLGGLTSLHYIVVVPEENDVLLVGSAEGWKIDGRGNVVGKVSQKPVMRLEDLVTLYRMIVRPERPSVISCSIDPTPEAMARVAAVKRTFDVVNQRNVNAYANALQEAYGMNVVTFRGVPENSRIAKILVAADYKMKRIGLDQEPSGLRSLPSYVSMLPRSSKHDTPRFWLAPEYSTVTYDSKKLIWKLGTVKVNALTEDEYIDTRNGARSSSGRTDATAVAWCKKMNDNYNELAKIDPVFAELKNVMELAMAVALIRSENLLDKAKCKLSLFDDDITMKMPSYPVPKYVQSESTMTRTVVACGGVEINPFTPLEKSTLDNKIDAEREKVAKWNSETWWSH